MRKVLLLSIAAVALAGGAQAAVIPDPLHGFCAAGCTEVTQGGNSVTTIIGSPGFTGADFGFWDSNGPASADFRLVIAEPDSATQVAPTVTGKINGVAVTPTVISIPASDDHWTAGDLDAQLAAELPGGANPTNPISNFLPYTQQSGIQPSATGYDLYMLDFNTQQLLGQNNTTGMDLTEVGGGPGSMIFGFFQVAQGNSSWTATASSGTLFDNGVNGTCISCRRAPEPASLAILSIGLLGLALARRRIL
jgi:hypothetical protein